MPAILMAGLKRWKTALRRQAVWNRLPDDVRKQIIDMALENSELSPRELATKFTDEKQYFVCEATVYRLLKAQDLIASPAYRHQGPRRVPHKDDPAQRDVADRFYLFQADRLGLGLLSTVLDDYSRYIISWKLCTP
jgi:transposase InsO family protein